MSGQCENDAQELQRRVAALEQERQEIPRLQAVIDQLRGENERLREESQSVAQANVNAANQLVELSNLRQKELEERHRALESQVRQRTQELRESNRDLMAAKERALESARLKSEFLANMSHELRTPLHGILSFASFGSTRSTTGERERLQYYFDQIRDSGSTLLELLNDLLDLAKLEAGKMSLKLEKRDLREIVTRVANEFSSLFDERELLLESELPEQDMPVRFDSLRIQQVIRNLLSNAAKFSPPGSRIRICLSRQGQAARLAIEDQGPGIPEDELQSIFEKFVQSSKTKTNAGGTGLGLAISRRILDDHNGRICAENLSTGGARFEFELPLANGSEDPRTAYLKG